MATASKMQAAEDLMKSMTPTELKQVMQYASRLRNSQACRLLELPPELRNRIYRLAIRPEAVENHALKGKAPALLKVNRQVSSEFIGLYYSPEFMEAKLYHPTTEAWEDVKDNLVLQAMVAKWGANNVCHATYLNAMSLSGMNMAISIMKKQLVRTDKHDAQWGVFSWLGSEKYGQEVLCTFSSRSLSWKLNERERRKHGDWFLERSERRCLSHCF
ncbi:hypothetical protein LTR37_016300 [Vermiconidia calcicola]|uniref:Uncharacterized protein n=1 Tax=Vermiconidia calcicola TaxID=1690605 RepID=A0ACC3MP01_9PEZI|nr:hypothetical protein LTR37_016300 [Vermiconidia calcicola]